MFGKFRQIISVSTMRFGLLVFLFVGGSCAYGEGDEKGGWKDVNNSDDVTEVDSDNWRDDDKRNGEGIRDVKEQVEGSRLRGERDEIYYPCDFEDDIDCVRNYFASSGQCKEVHNYGRKPVYRNRLIAYLPGFNLTLVSTNTRIKYIGDRINRFYINKKTENLVMNVDFERINIDSKYTTFIYQRRGREPIKRTDSANGTFTVTLTAVIPIKKDVDFKESRVTTYLSSLPEQLTIGPKVLGSSEPVVLKVNTALFANLQQAALEIFLTEGPSLFLGYLQNYICDFDIPISA